MAASTDQDPKKKTLPLPVHGDPRNEEEIIDGEIITEDETGPRQPAQPSAPGSDDRRSRERGQRRARAWEERRAREEKAGTLPTPKAPAHGTLNPDGSLRPMNTPIGRLRQDVDQAGRQYMKNVRKADLYAAKREPRERRSQLTGIHKSYVSMMVLSCVEPLSQGVSAKSVLNVIGMGSAMWMMSPNFRDQVGDFADQMRETVIAKIDERKEGKIEKARGKVDKKTEKRAKKDKPLSRRWEDRLHRVEKAERGGREAFTAKSAGMTEVALTENAYAAMRQDGADVDAIRDAHAGMVKDLYRQAAEDGVDADELATASRIVVGLRLEEEPELASVFGELGHGGFTRSEAREVRLSGSGEPATVWTGEFENRFGQPITAGSFGLRAPMDAAAHRAAMADTMTADMLALARERGVDGLNVGMVSFGAAWGLREHENYDAMTGMDTPLGERLNLSRIMLHSMEADGFGADEQRLAYSHAYVDSLELVSTLHPEMEEEWAAKFGDNWRENMREFVTNPHNYMGEPGGESAAEADYEAEPGARGGTAWEAGPAADRTGPRAGDAGPSTSSAASRKYRAARINQNYIETAPTGVTGVGADNSDHRDQDFEMGG